MYWATLVFVLWLALGMVGALLWHFLRKYDDPPAFVVALGGPVFWLLVFLNWLDRRV